MPWLRSLAVDLTPLRASRDYRLLYIGQFVSLFGTAISYVVLPVQMYAITHSSFAVGMLGVAEFGPTLALAFVGGALADAVDRRRLILICEAGMAACCVVLAANARGRRRVPGCCLPRRPSWPASMPCTGPRWKR